MSQTHTYEILSAKYDATQPTPNPKVVIVGTIDGIEYVVSTNWRAIQIANTNGGADAVKSVLGPIMLNAWIINKQLLDGSQQVEVPRLSPVEVEPPVTGWDLGWQDVTNALVGSWTA